MNWKRELNSDMKGRRHVSWLLLKHGLANRNLGSLWEKQVAQKAKGIITQSDHILSNEFSNAVRSALHHASQ